MEWKKGLTGKQIYKVNRSFDFADKVVSVEVLGAKFPQQYDRLLVVYNFNGKTFRTNLSSWGSNKNV